jgi:tetratricopeptide (TPR) repeat protein
MSEIEVSGLRHSIFSRGQVPLFPLCVCAALVIVFSCSRETIADRAREEYERGQYREALFLIKHHFKKGGERSPELLFLAGQSWLRLGIEAEADDAFAEVYSSDSTWAPRIAQEFKSEALNSMERGLEARGERFLQQALNYDPHLDFGHCNAMAGELLLERGDYEGSVAHLERYLEEYPDTAGAAQVMMHLGTAYEGMGEIDKAIETYRLFERRYDKSRLKTTASWRIENLLYSKAEDRKAGGEMHEAAAILEPLAQAAQNPLVRERANFLLGEIYEEQGDMTRALSYYRQVINLNLGSSGRLVERAKERIERIEISKSIK